MYLVPYTAVVTIKYTIYSRYTCVVSDGSRVVGYRVNTMRVV